MPALSALPPAGNRRPGTGELARRLVLVLCLGAGIGVVVALGLYGAKPVGVMLLPLGLLALLSSVFVRNVRLYWFGIFLLSSQLSISKNLNDGIAVIQALKIDYTISAFTFEVTLTDLVLLVLLALWANDRLFNRKPIRFPRVTWLAVVYLGICLITTFMAPLSYLGFVEMSRQVKLFIVYLFAANCLQTKAALRTVAVLGVVILATQGGMTVTRFETGYMTPIGAGDSHQDEAQIEQYLTVDRFDEGSAVRAFGTLGSPGGTVRLCMMVIPFALFLCAPNTMVRFRFVFAALTALGLLGLVLTFTRVYYITTALQLVLVFSIMLRDRLLRRDEVIAVVLLGLVALAAAAPKLYQQFNVRTESVSVRFLQYEAAARMILDNPLLGVGLNNGTSQKPKYNTITYNPSDPDTQFFLEPTHNLYLSMASEIGLIGLAFFVAFFARVTLVAWRQSRRSPDPDIRWSASAFVVVMISVAINGMMDPLQEYQVLVVLWLYAGVILNLPDMAQEPAAARRRPARSPRQPIRA